MARRWADVAELIATQGLKGRLVARSVRGLPFLLHEGLTVHFVPPTLDGLVRPACAACSISVRKNMRCNSAASRNGIPPSFWRAAIVWSPAPTFPTISRISCALRRSISRGFWLSTNFWVMFGTISDVRKCPARTLLVVARRAGRCAFPCGKVSSNSTMRRGSVRGFAGRACRSRRFERIERKGRRVPL